MKSDLAKEIDGEKESKSLEYHPVMPFWTTW